MKKPQRAFHLTAELGADDKRSLIGLLHELIGEIRAGVPESVFGGASIGGYWKLTADPTMTNERFHELNDQYLESFKSKD